MSLFIFTFFQLSKFLSLEIVDETIILTVVTMSSEHSLHDVNERDN